MFRLNFLLLIVLVLVQIASYSLFSSSSMAKSDENIYASLPEIIICPRESSLKKAHMVSPAKKVYLFLPEADPFRCIDNALKEINKHGTILLYTNYTLRRLSIENKPEVLLSNYKLEIGTNKVVGFDIHSDGTGRVLLAVPKISQIHNATLFLDLAETITSIARSHQVGVRKLYIFPVSYDLLGEAPQGMSLAILLEGKLGWFFDELRRRQITYSIGYVQGIPYITIESRVLEVVDSYEELVKLVEQALPRDRWVIIRVVDKPLAIDPLLVASTRTYTQSQATMGREQGAENTTVHTSLPRTEIDIPKILIRTTKGEKIVITTVDLAEEQPSLEIILVALLLPLALLVLLTNIKKH